MFVCTYYAIMYSQLYNMYSYHKTIYYTSLSLSIYIYIYICTHVHLSLLIFPSDGIDPTRKKCCEEAGTRPVPGLGKGFTKISRGLFRDATWFTCSIVRAPDPCRHVLSYHLR